VSSRESDKTLIIKLVKLTLEVIQPHILGHSSDLPQMWGLTASPLSFLDLKRGVSINKAFEP
jgi:hypothetical protein